MPHLGPPGVLRVPRHCDLSHSLALLRHPLRHSHCFRVLGDPPHPPSQCWTHSAHSVLSTVPTVCTLTPPGGGCRVLVQGPDEAWRETLVCHIFKTFQSPCWYFWPCPVYVLALCYLFPEVSMYFLYFCIFGPRSSLPLNCSSTLSACIFLFSEAWLMLSFLISLFQSFDPTQFVFL